MVDTCTHDTPADTAVWTTYTKWMLSGCPSPSFKVSGEMYYRALGRKQSQLSACCGGWAVGMQQGHREGACACLGLPRTCAGPLAEG